MPGPALHDLIARRLRSNISRNEGLGENMSAADYARLQTLLADPKNLPYLFLGCQGPDFLFFNTKDMNPQLGKFVEFYMEVTDFIENFKRELLKIVPQPVLDALEAFDEAVDEVIEDSALLSELKQTFEDINRLLDALIPLLTEMIKKFISEFNLFDLISHPYRDGANDGEWWWFDALHYRKTGKYAKALLENSDPSKPEHLYALGYLTHVAADTVGHPYVNIVSGGPYRSQAQRHKTGENYQDVFNFLTQTGQDLNRSKLHAFYNFNFDGTISDSEPDTFTNLPDDLSNFIADTLSKVYRANEAAGEKYGPEITAKDVNNAYKIYYKWFRNSTETGVLPLPVPYSLTAELREVWEKTMDNLGDAGDFLENAVDEAGDWGFLSIFIILAALIIAAVMAAAALADGIAGAITTLGTSTIRYAACLIYEQVYNAFQNFRLGTALNGLAFPMQEHLPEPRLLQFANPAIPDPTGAKASDFIAKLPMFKFITNFGADPMAAIFNQERHLIYPPTGGEKKPVLEAPLDYFNKFSTHYAFGNIPINNKFIDDLIKMSDDNNAMNNDNGDELADKLANPKNRLGNALKLTENLYNRYKSKEPVPDFNLDGDRGYAYMCWSQENKTTPPTVEDSDSPKELRAKDDPANPTDQDEIVQLRFIQ
jgi:hypothetical protein